MSDRDKNTWFTIGYISALAVLWIASVGIPRLLDWLSMDAQVIVLDSPSDNGTKTKAETSEVVKESVET